MSPAAARGSCSWRPIRRRVGFVSASPRPRLVALVAGLAGLAAVAQLVVGPPDPGSWALARAAAATGAPLLADVKLGQQAVLDGGHLWVGNPIDAFSRADQRVFLDWLAGQPTGAAALRHAGYVLVERGSPAGRRALGDPALTLVRESGPAALLRVRPRP